MSVGVYRKRFTYQQRKRLPVPLRPVVAAAAATTLDSKAKRASIPGVGRPWYRTKQPAANSVAWRIASGNAYGGNALIAPVAYGQLCVPASQFYFPGSLAGQIYSPGAYDQETYSPGATESQIGCC